MPVISRLAGRQPVFWAVIAVLSSLSAGPLLADPLRFVNDDYLGPYEEVSDDKAPGLGVEVLKQVFSGMGQDVSFERLPVKRAWMMVIRGERDGMLATLRTREGERFCSFSDEPIIQDKWVLFVRTADIGRLKFSSLNDLIGHDVAVRGPVPEVSEQPPVSPEFRSFLRQHQNMVATNGTTASLRMLVAGRVDYAVASLAYGTREITKMGWSGKIEPLLSRTLNEEGVYVCFTKTRVSPSLVNAFSRALREFKRTEAFQAIYHKYFP